MVTGSLARLRCIGRTVQIMRVIRSLQDVAAVLCMLVHSIILPLSLSMSSSS